MTFTKEQLSDWKRYERVRRSGRHNMFFPQARAETGLSEERYSFALQNYSELKEAVNGVAPSESK